MPIDNQGRYYDTVSQTRLETTNVRTAQMPQPKALFGAQGYSLTMEQARRVIAETRAKGPVSLVDSR